MNVAEHSFARLVLHVLGWRLSVICEFYTENSGNLSFFPKHGKQWDWKSEATPGARGAGRREMRNRRCQWIRRGLAVRMCMRCGPQESSSRDP